MDAGYVLIWHSLLASWKSPSITALRNWNQTSSFQCQVLRFNLSSSRLTQSRILNKCMKKFYGFWTKHVELKPFLQQSWECRISHVDWSLYLNYQLHWCLKFFILNILLLGSFFIRLICGKRLRCWGSMCCSSWQTINILIIIANKNHSSSHVSLHLFPWHFEFVQQPTYYCWVQRQCFWHVFHFQLIFRRRSRLCSFLSPEITFKI